MKQKNLLNKPKMSKDKIKGAASFMTSKRDVVDIHCDKKENLIDYSWLFNNIPWTNHDGEVGKVTMDEPTDAHVIIMNGFDKSTIEINKIVFDNVEIIAIHGFAGNSFTFNFKLGEEDVAIATEYDRFAFTKEEAKNRYIKTLENIIAGLNQQIDLNKSAISRLKNL